MMFMGTIIVQRTKQSPQLHSAEEMLQYLTLKHEVTINAVGVGGKLLDKPGLYMEGTVHEDLDASVRNPMSP
jgi:hypothetical protein